MIFVVDSADRERIQEAKEELMRVLDTPEMRNVPLVVVANKQDLPGVYTRTYNNTRTNNYVLLKIVVTFIEECGHAV